jgi:hypothetical protein
MTNYKVCIISIFSFIVSGCISQIASFKDHKESWKGQPIAHIFEARALPHTDRSDFKGMERTTKLENGNLLYEIPYRYCPVFFEVDSNGIIVDITTEGNEDCY